MSILILSLLTAAKTSTEEAMRLPILTLVLVSGATISLGGCRHRHGPDMQEIYKFVSWRVDDVLDDIHATDEQRQLVNSSKDRLFETAKRNHADKQADALAMIAEWESDQPDVAAIKALIDKKLEQHRAFAYQAVDEAIAIHGALNPDQRNELAALIKERLADD